METILLQYRVYLLYFKFFWREDSKLTFESKYSEDHLDNFWDEIYRQERELKEIKAMLYSSSYKDSKQDKDKKAHCDCHKKVLSHSYNPCFEHKHEHHHNKCSCNHKEHFHAYNPCLDHKHGHHHWQGHGHHHSPCFGNHHGHHHHSQCFSSHHGHGHCEDFFLVDHCCGPKAFSHNNCCNKHFSLHLAGLTGDLNFQLFRRKGCCAKVELECASETKSIEGRVCAIGIDFVDILKNDKTVVTIMKQRICTIHWLDKCDHHSYLPSCDTDDEEVEVVETVEAVEEIDARQ